MHGLSPEEEIDYWRERARRAEAKSKKYELSAGERAAVYDWIREGDSQQTIGTVTDVLKRLLGGG